MFWPSLLAAVSPGAAFGRKEGRIVSLTDSAAADANFLPVQSVPRASAEAGMCYEDADAAMTPARTWPWDTLRKTAPFFARGSIVPYKFCVPAFVVARGAAAELEWNFGQWGQWDCWSLPWLMDIATGGAGRQPPPGSNQAASMAAAAAAASNDDAKQRGFFADLGLNVGLCSLPMLARGHRVAAFEASQGGLEGGLEAARVNGVAHRFSVYRVVISDRERGVGFMRCTAPEDCIVPYQQVSPAECNTPGLRMPAPATGSWDQEKAALLAAHPAAAAFEGDATCVQAARLDRLLRHEPRIDLMKVDVDGSELQALRGARRFFKERRVGLAHIELVAAEMENSGTAWADFVRLVEGEYGYEMYLLQYCAACELADESEAAVASGGRQCSTSLGRLKNADGGVVDQVSWDADNEVGGIEVARGVKGEYDDVQCPPGRCLGIHWYLERPPAAHKPHAMDDLAEDQGRARSQHWVAVSPALQARVGAAHVGRASARCVKRGMAPIFPRSREERACRRSDIPRGGKSAAACGREEEGRRQQRGGSGTSSSRREGGAGDRGGVGGGGGAARGGRMAERLQLAFAHFDADGDGAWSLGEINAMQAALGEPPLPSLQAFKEAALGAGVALVGGTAISPAGVRTMYATLEAGDMAKLEAAGQLS